MKHTPELPSTLTFEVKNFIIIKYYGLLEPKTDVSVKEYEGKAEPFMIKMKRKTKRNLILLGMGAAVVILILLLVHGVKSALHRRVDTSAGLAYIEKEESGNVSDIEDKISILEQQSSSDGEKSEDTRSIKEKFGGAVVIGDSVTQGLEEFDILNSSSVISQIGVHLYEADELIAGAKELSPRVVFLSFGRNDLAATEGDKEEFISQYTSVLNKVSEELPDANIFVNSILPVQDSALEEDPYLENIQDYNTALKELCDSRSIGFIDNTSIAEEEYFEQDGQHFKAGFYPIWAEHMAEVAAL